MGAENDKFTNMEDFLGNDNPDPAKAAEAAAAAAAAGTETNPDGTPKTTPAPELNPDGTPKVKEGELNPDGTPKAKAGELNPDGTPKTPDPNKKPDPAKKPDGPNPMKELRDKASNAEKSQKKIDDAINRLSDGEYDFKLKDFKTEAGKVDYDALIKAMDDQDVKKRAETRGVTPELQAEIEKYEREKKTVELDKARVQMDRQLNNFQMEQKLSADELNSFISDAMKIGINPLSIAALDKSSKGTTSLKLLYQAVYTDKIVKAAVDKALADDAAARAAAEQAKNGQPKSNPGQPNNNKTGTKDSKGMAIEDFLKTL